MAVEIDVRRWLAPTVPAAPWPKNVVRPVVLAVSMVYGEAKAMKNVRSMATVLVRHTAEPLQPQLEKPAIATLKPIGTATSHSDDAH